jgi:hypothetical protein
MVTAARDKVLMSTPGMVHGRIDFSSLTDGSSSQKVVTIRKIV